MQILNKVLAGKLLKNCRIYIFTHCRTVQRTKTLFRRSCSELSGSCMFSKLGCQTKTPICGKQAKITVSIMPCKVLFSPVLQIMESTSDATLSDTLFRAITRKKSEETSINDGKRQSCIFLRRNWVIDAQLKKAINTKSFYTVFVPSASASINGH